MCAVQVPHGPRCFFVVVGPNWRQVFVELPQLGYERGSHHRPNDVTIQSDETPWMRWKELLTPRCTPLFFSQILKPVCLYTNSGNEEQLQHCTTAGTRNSSGCVWGTRILPRQ